MESVAGLMLLALVLAGALCFLFLAVVQPVWGIVDVATSNEHSGGTKAVVIVLTLMLLGPIMTIGYAFLGTRSKPLRLITLITVAGLLIVVTSGIGLACLVPAAKRIWSSAAESPPAFGAERAGHTVAGAANPLPADELAPFTALHLVPKEGSGWSVSIAQFTGFGPKPDSAIPLVPPSIYPFTHLAMDPDGPVYYAITTHQVGRIIPATGRFLEFESDPAVGKPSWPSAIAWDSKAQVLLIAARSHGYSYKPSTGEWKILPGLADNNLVALEYDPEEGVVYGLRTRTGGELATTLVTLSPNGATLSETELSRPIPVGRYPFTLAQLRWAYDRLVVLVAPSERGPRPISLAQPAMYSLDPATGLCRIVQTQTGLGTARLSDQ